MGRTKGKGHAWCERDRNGCCGGLEVCVLMHDQAVIIKPLYDDCNRRHVHWIYSN